MSKDTFKQSFATRLFNIIEDKKISRAELAEKAEIGYASLASYLAAQNAGKGALPPLDVTVRLATALGVTTDYLLCGRQNIATPTEQSTTEPQESKAQQLLGNLYQAAAALNLQTEIPDNGGVVLISQNQFVRLFFQQIERGDTPETALSKFSDLKVSKGTLMDPVTYRLLYGEGGEK